MNKFEIGDWVYASDWCYGQIVGLHHNGADVEFETCSGGGTLYFTFDELRKGK